MSSKSDSIAATIAEMIRDSEASFQSRMNPKCEACGSPKKWATDGIVGWWECEKCQGTDNA